MTKQDIIIMTIDETIIRVSVGKEKLENIISLLGRLRIQKEVNDDFLRALGPASKRVSEAVDQLNALFS